jgi:hypothetical protein
MAPTERQGGEEGASLDAQSVRSDFHSGFFTILNNVTVVRQPEAKSELPSLTLTQEASEKDQEGDARNSAAVDFAEAFWQ